MSEFSTAVNSSKSTPTNEQISEAITSNNEVQTDQEKQNFPPEKDDVVVISHSQLNTIWHNVETSNSAISSISRIMKTVVSADIHENLPEEFMWLKSDLARESLSGGIEMLSERVSEYQDKLFDILCDAQEVR